MRSICGVEVSPGDSREICLKISESFVSSPVDIPVTVIRGRSPGPTGFVVAAVHGNEINGVDIVRRLIYYLDPARMAGALILVPVVNIQGFHAQSRYLPYFRDLNRFFPGSRKGNHAQQIAARIFDEIVLGCDFGIDLHTAGEGRLNLPHVRGDMSNDKVSDLAHAFGAAILIDHAGVQGALRKEATAAGVPTIIFEAGEPGRFDPRISRAGFKGLLNLLHTRGMIPPDKRLGIPLAPPFQVTVRKRRWIRARRGGLLELRVRPGDLVYRGDVLGTVVNPYGRRVKKIRTSVTGMVIGTSVQPLAAPGTAIAHVAELDKALQIVEKSFLKDRVNWQRSALKAQLKRRR